MNNIAKNLRKRSTDAEKLLWRHLRAKQLEGLKFREGKDKGDPVKEGSKRESLCQGKGNYPLEKEPNKMQIKMDRHDGEVNNTVASPKGIALLLVLWVLTILMVISLSFSFMARTETYSTLSFKEGIEKKFIAEAGIERG
ncbi:MAG: DUF559 domain-containing protein, partial [Nitrospirota bacterium]|nr:DUF559 domain-containing protein [Nitrospirota bacterium]